MDPMYRIGEALIGDGPELAHVDLLIGDKQGPVGQAFANGLSNLSVGHTPLTSVIRPNLMTKPATLIIPKVTVGDLEDASKIFGPAQTAVARAVADAVEDGYIPKDIVEDIVINVSVFIDPSAEDYRKIYQYNYGAIVELTQSWDSKSKNSGAHHTCKLHLTLTTNKQWQKSSMIYQTTTESYSKQVLRLLKNSVSALLEKSEHYVQMHSLLQT